MIPGRHQGGFYLRKCFSYPNTGAEACRFPCSLLVRPSYCLICPDFFCNLLDKRQLAPLILFGDKVAFLGGSEAALRAERQLLERHIFGSLADTRDNVFLVLQLGVLEGYQTQYDLLLADVAQRLETACTGQTGRACTDDGNLVAVGLRLNSLFGAVFARIVGYKTLQTADFYSLVLDAAYAVALTLALLRADDKLDSFSDAASVSSYAVNAMQWAVANGIVNGSNGKLNSQNNATRAQVTAILMRFYEMSK